MYIHLIYRFTYTKQRSQDCFFGISKICHISFWIKQIRMANNFPGWKLAGGKGGWHCLPSMAPTISGCWGIADAEFWAAEFINGMGMITLW